MRAILALLFVLVGGSAWGQCTNTNGTLNDITNCPGPVYYKGPLFVGPNGNIQGPGLINPQTGTAYTLRQTDCNATVVVTNSSPITVTTFVAPVGCFIVVVQGGAGQITFANGAGASLVSAHGYSHTFNAAGATVGLAVYTSGVFTLTGDGA